MSENLKHFLVALPLTLVVVAIAFIGYSSYAYSNLGETTKVVEAEIEELKIGIAGDIWGIYPDVPGEVISMNVNGAFFEGLSTFDDNFRIKPLLAESWNNPDDNTWRIYLKKNVKFHNGETLKASDVKFTIDYMKENEG